MVSRVRLLVDVEELVAWSDHERRTELGRSTAGLVLAVTPDQRSRTCHPRVGTERGCCSQLVQRHNSRSGPFLVQEHRKRHRLVLDEGCCILSTTGTNCRDA